MRQRGSCLCKGGQHFLLQIHQTQHIKIEETRGAWLAQPVENTTLETLDIGVMISSPTMDVELTFKKMEIILSVSGQLCVAYN